MRFIHIRLCLTLSAFVCSCRVFSRRESPAVLPRSIRGPAIPILPPYRAIIHRVNPASSLRSLASRKRNSHFSFSRSPSAMSWHRAAKRFEVRHQFLAAKTGIGSVMHVERSALPLATLAMAECAREDRCTFCLPDRRRKVIVVDPTPANRQGVRLRIFSGGQPGNIPSPKCVADPLTSGMNSSRNAGNPGVMPVCLRRLLTPPYGLLRDVLTGKIEAK